MFAGLYLFFFTPPALLILRYQRETGLGATAETKRTSATRVNFYRREDSYPNSKSGEEATSRKSGTQRRGKDQLCQALERQKRFKRAKC